MKFISPAYYLTLFRCLNGRKLDLTNESSLPLSLCFFPLHFRVYRGKHTKLIRNETAGKAGEKQKEKSWNGMIMTITRHRYTDQTSISVPFGLILNGGRALEKWKTTTKQPKTMTGVGEPRGGYQLLDRFPLFSPINQLLHHLLSRSSLYTASTSKTKTYTWKSIPKSATRNSDGRSPPFKTTTKKQNKQPKMSKKKRAK